MGEKPLYYGWMHGTFVFGSQLKALRAHPAWRGEIDRNALAAYLRHNYVPAPHSIYRGIAKLKAGHYNVIHRGRNEASPVCYWSMREAAEAGVSNAIGADEAAITDELDALLRDAVKLRTVADVPVGVFLSGGVDSSTVTALMQAQASGAVKTFSIGFEEKAYNEAGYAKAVAAHLGTDHTELYVTAADALATVPMLPQVYDEPFSDASQIPTLLVSRLARKNVTVSLSGDGGDELFCGYVRYFWGCRVWNQVRRMPYPLRAAAGSAMKLLSQDAWDSMLRVVPNSYRSTSGREINGSRVHKLADVFAMRTPDDFYHGLVSHWSDPDTVVHGAREAATALTDPTQWPAIDDFTQRMMYFDAVTYLPDDILVKVDRASMSVGLEARVPFLDHRVVEYAWRIPLSLKIKDGEGKRPLRNVLDRYVPRELIDRPKMGFGIPVAAWLRGPLRDWAENLISEARLRADGLFNVPAVRTKWAQHLAGTGNWEHALWDVLMFQAWLDHERVRDDTAMAKA
jgi:asparagine synthase (glutamine-hydrolysing)